jgi:hypothetical protein
MKRILAAALVAGAVGSALAQPQVGVSVSINQPGVYGRVTIGEVRPALVLPQPVIISQPSVVVHRTPVYLYVPDDHQQNWRRYCGRYAACGQPVYFVRDDWVRDRYERHHPGWDNGRHHASDKGHGHGHGHGKGHDKGHGKGHDKGQGHGHDKGKH